MDNILHQIKRPDPIEKDSKGSDFLPGDEVAYNRSGEVKIGEIVSINRNEWKKIRDGSGSKTWWKLMFSMTIKNKCCGDTSESVIKNPNSFIVIR